MPVLVSCTCGRQLRAPDDAVGQRVKSPGRGPARPVSGADPTPPPAKRPSALKGVVRFACTCGKQMQAKAEFAGRMTKCPGCGAELEIPDPDASPSGRTRKDR